MEKQEQKACVCSTDEKMVLACSGACDLGHLTDIVARKLNENKVRKMFCLAVVAAGIEKSIEDLKKKNIFMIDGCPVDCGKKILDKAGFKEYKYMRVSDMGYKKGETPVNEVVISAVYEMAKKYN